MDYFSIRKQFICPTFELEVEEAAFFEKYYAFLDRSGVGEIIRKHIRNDGSSGGRPNVNYYNLFAVILYGFSHGRSTLLYFLGLNLRRLLDFYKTGKQLSFCSAPKDLVPELFKKPSAKRLSQKGKKINEKTMQEKKKK